eukprot:7977098-Pyramimonas_sp.AAC.1
MFPQLGLWGPVRASGTKHWSRWIPGMAPGTYLAQIDRGREQDDDHDDEEVPWKDFGLERVGGFSGCGE